MSFDLKEFKRLAENRTSAPWELRGKDKDMIRTEVRGNLEGYGISCKTQDAEFIAYCGTHADAIIERIEKLEKALEFYANPEHWTIEWVEGSHGDYGSRARKALKERGE